jgi:hypothetical protein
LWAIAVPSLVAHECLHATWQILSKSGVPGLIDEKEEVFAYLLDWLVVEVTKRLVRPKRQARVVKSR